MQAEISFGKKLNLFGSLEGLDTEGGFDFRQYDLACGKPLVQPAGEKLRRITIRLNLSNFANLQVFEQKDIGEIIDELEEMNSSGESHVVIIGNYYQSQSVAMGKYYIESLRKKITKILPTGKIIECGIDIGLVEAVERKTIEVVKIEKQKPKPTRRGKKVTQKEKEKEERAMSSDVWDY